MKKVLCFIVLVITITGSFAQTKKDNDVWMLTYFRQRYPTRIEIDEKGNTVEVPLPDPMLVAKLHIALSTDGRHWTPLNDNNPVWDTQMRDPYVRRGPDGLWRILSTGGGRGLDREKVGPSCLYMTSKDMIHWQVEGPLTLMKDARNDAGELARNIWAPEWYYDNKTGEYILFWSSSYKDAGWKESRLWYCKTRDWKTFTPAKVLFAPSYSVIDGTLQEHDGTYYLFHKEEEFGALTGERRAIRVATSKNLEGPYSIIEGPLNKGQIVPVITEGPTVMKDPVKPGWLLLYDYCMTNRFGASYSPDLIHWTVEDDVSFPSEARHGCVSLLTPEEAKALKEAFPSSNKPTIAREDWGSVDTKPVFLYTLTNSNGVTAKITNYGCTIVELNVPDKKGQMENIVLGLNNIDEYQGRHPCFGCIIGRCVNRISDAKFTLDKKEYTLATNSGKNHIHGGIDNFSRKVWDVTASSDENSATLSFTYLSADMEEGYPGNLTLKVDYVLNNNNELQLRYTATTDKPTVINLTNHSYFNLSGCKDDIRTHQVRIYADRYTPTGEGLIPTGEIAPVAGTPYDLRQWTTLFDRWPDLPRGGFDNNYCVKGTPGNIVLAAELYDPKSGRLLQTYTTEPGMQFYTAANLRYQTKQGYAFSGACFEAQHYPDSPNNPNFPTTVLRPGETYTQTTVYKVGLKTIPDNAEQKWAVIPFDSPDPTAIMSPDGKGLYVFTTGRGIQILYSSNFIDWERYDRIFTEARFPNSMPDWASQALPRARGIWAPDVVFHNGKYYVYYAVSTVGSQRSVIGLATNKTLDKTHPDYLWVDEGMVLESHPDHTDYNAIDAAFFVDDDGKAYLFWGSYWTGLKAVEVDAKTGKPFRYAPSELKIPAGYVAVASRPDHSIEAPYVIRRGKYYYLFTSQGTTLEGAESTYRIAVGRSENPLGPYIDRDGNPMTQGGGTVIFSGTENWKGTGHNGFFRTTKDGKNSRDWIIFHAYDAQDSRKGRLTQIRPLYWNESAWPIVGEILDVPFE